MKLKEIRLTDVKIFQNNSLVYQGTVDQAPSDLKDQEIQSIDFESNLLLITL